MLALYLLSGFTTERGSPQGTRTCTENNPIAVRVTDLCRSIIDVHSHLGDEQSPAFLGANDGNSIHGPILPWLRSLDAINTHDDGTAQPPRSVMHTGT